MQLVTCIWKRSSSSPLSRSPTPTIRTPTSASCTRRRRCPNGTIAYLGATTCSVCDPGRVLTNAPGAVGLSSFDWSYYGWQQSPIDCYDCPLGTFSNSSGSTACTPCPLGYYTAQPRSTSCQLCPAGRYVPPGDNRCLPCPPGTCVSTKCHMRQLPGLRHNSWV